MTITLRPGSGATLTHACLTIRAGIVTVTHCPICGFQAWAVPGKAPVVTHEGDRGAVHRVDREWAEVTGLEE